MLGDWASTIKFCLVVVTTIVTAWILVSAVRRRLSVPPRIGAEKDIQAQRDTAIENRLSLSAKLFDISAALLAFFWALAVLDKSGAKLSVWEDAFLFAVTNVLLLLCMLFHLLYKRRVSTLQWDLSPGQPDIFSEHVDYLFRTQWLLFFWSLVVGLLTVVAVVVLAGAPSRGDPG